MWPHSHHGSIVNPRRLPGAKAGIGLQHLLAVHGRRRLVGRLLRLSAQATSARGGMPAMTNDPAPGRQSVHTRTRTNSRHDAKRRVGHREIRELEAS